MQNTVKVDLFLLLGEAEKVGYILSFRFPQNVNLILRIRERGKLVFVKYINGFWKKHD